MKIDRDEARRVAALAHLAFEDAALDRMAVEMTKILGYIDMLREVDLAASAVSESAGEDTRATLREDGVAPSLDRSDVERNAPDWSDGFFVVPPVIEGE